MTREAFIRKWLANKDFQYCEDGRAQMREDLDKVIYHAHQKLDIASVSGSASGAVDKTVSVGCVCGSHDTVTRHMIRQCADCGRPI